MFMKKSATHKSRLGARLTVWGLAAVGVYAIGSTIKEKVCCAAKGCKKMMIKMKKSDPSHNCCDTVPDEDANIT
jgi:hypothetical protein